MIKPNRLMVGDCVAIINPAGMLPNRFSKQLHYIKEYLESLGFSVKDCMEYDDWQNAQKRADKINQCFDDDSIRAIFPVCGGNLVYDILNKLDYDLIGKNPKIICGSSELSSLMNIITERSQLITFSAPHLNFINHKSSKRENLFTIRSFWNMFLWQWQGKKGLDNHEAYNFFKAPKNEEAAIEMHNIYFRHDKIRKDKYKDNYFIALDKYGNITGLPLVISLESLIKLLNKGFTFNLRNKILMLDTLDKNFDDVVSLMKVLTNQIDFQIISTLCFTSITERTDRINKNFPELCRLDDIKYFLTRAEKIINKELPIIFGFPIGHCSYKLTVPIGIPISIDTETGNIILKEKPFN